MNSIKLNENKNVQGNDNWEYKKLEFEKILESVSYYSLSQIGKDNILLLKPGISKEEILFQHKILTQLSRYFSKEESLSINVIFNFNQSLKKSQKKMLLDAVSLYEIAFSIKQYFFLQKRFNVEKYSELNKLFTIEKLIDTFYLDILKFIKKDGFVESAASSELANVRERVSSTEQKIKKATNDFYKEAKNLNYLSEDIISVRDGFSCIAIKSNYKNRLDGIVLDSSGTGQTVFIVSKKVIEFHNELVILKEKENDEIRKILLFYTDKILDNVENLFVIDKELIDFDVLYSKTRYCVDNNCVSPKIISEKRIKIINGRHPLIGKNAIPLNIEIGDNFKILVITGPNTGGKTVVLKTTGIFVLMVQCGIGIPASEDSEFSIFTKLFVDIGDEQSIEQSLSTFSSHISKIIYMLKYANLNSLILLDELGAGTDPTEGSALGISILKYLKKIRSVSIVTTHYSALKHFANDEEGIENASMEFDIENLKPTYKLLVGIPGNSRALEISKRLGMPDEILIEARNNIKDDYLNSEKMIAKLEVERKKIVEYENVLNNKEIELREKEEIIQRREVEFLEKEKELNKLQKSKSFEFLNESRKEFENIIKNLRTSGASKDTIVEGKKFFDEINDKLKSDEIEENINTKLHDFKIGDSIEVISSGLKGNIISKTNNENEFLAQVGIVKLNLKSNEIKYVDDKNKIEYNQKPTISYIPSSKDISLDLRGARYDEAEKKLDKFVESALAGNISFIKIIHGKGSGAIRKCIQEYFDNSPFIAEYNYEKDENRGINYGITIARLR